MQLRHHEKSIIVSLPLGLMVSLYFLWQFQCAGFVAIEFGALAISPFIGSVIGVLLITSSIVSGASYIGRVLDILLDDATEYHIEGWFTILGIALGTLVSILLLTSGFEVPFAGVLPFLPQMMFVVVMVGACAGLCARMGRVIDRIMAPEDSTLTPLIDKHHWSNARSIDFAPKESVISQRLKQEIELVAPYFLRRPLGFLSPSADISARVTSRTTVLSN